MGSATSSPTEGTWCHQAGITPLQAGAARAIPVQPAHPVSAIAKSEPDSLSNDVPNKISHHYDA